MIIYFYRTHVAFLVTYQYKNRIAYRLIDNFECTPDSLVNFGKRDEIDEIL